MTTYKTSFEKLRQAPEAAEMLAALERGFHKFGIDFYLIGAVARDVWMRAINDLAPRRTTQDIDFAILINKPGEFEALKDYLTETEGFTGYKENAFVLRWHNKLEIDLMPFGEIEENNNIKVTGPGFTSLHVPGFKEVYASDLPEIELENSQRFKFCSIPGIVLLKLLAWNDRPEHRTSDIQDITDILQHYFEMFMDEIYENHLDLYDTEVEGNDLTLQVAAQVLGREIGSIIRINQQLAKQVVTILEKNTLNSAKSPIADIMARFSNTTIEQNIALLLKIKLGIKETAN